MNNELQTKEKKVHFAENKNKVKIIENNQKKRKTGNRRGGLKKKLKIIELTKIKKIKKGEIKQIKSNNNDDFKNKEIITNDMEKKDKEHVIANKQNKYKTNKLKKNQNIKMSNNSGFKENTFNENTKTQNDDNKIKNEKQRNNFKNNRNGDHEMQSNFCKNNKKDDIKYVKNPQLQYKSAKNNKRKNDELVHNKKGNFEKTEQNFTKPNAIKNKTKNILTDLEKELLAKGTKKDQINTLTLIIEKNPENCYEEFNNLLEKCQNERNDTVYYILKNIKDLLLSSLKIKSDDSNFLMLKRKLINTLEFYLKNKHIKNKVLGLVYELLKNNVLFMELIYIFINKLGDKKETSNLVFNYLKELYQSDINRKLILFGLEEFYHKDFKSRSKVVDFVNKFCKNENTNLHMLFYEHLRNKDYKDKDNFEKILENIVKGMINTYTDKKEFFDESLLLNIYNNAYLNYNILYFLYKINSCYFFKHLLKIIRSLKMKDFTEMPLFLNLIYEYLVNEKNNTNRIVILESLLSCATFYNRKYTLSILLVISKLNTKDIINELHCLKIFNNYYCPITAHLSSLILDNKPIEIFDPYNECDLEKMSVFY